LYVESIKVEKLRGIAKAEIRDFNNINIFVGKTTLGNHQY